MLKSIIKLDGIQVLSKSQQKSIGGSGSCATGIYCQTVEDCGGQFSGAACIKYRCHFF